MFMASCYNYNADDTFTAFGKTSEDAINKVVETYCKWYHMTDEDAQDEGYDTMLDYILEAKGIDVVEVKEGGCYVNREWRN